MPVRWMLESSRVGLEVARFPTSANLSMRCPLPGHYERPYEILEGDSSRIRACFLELKIGPAKNCITRLNHSQR